VTDLYIFTRGGHTAHEIIAGHVFMFNFASVFGVYI
jgi:hypothetical protein